MAKASRVRRWTRRLTDWAFVPRKKIRTVKQRSCRHESLERRHPLAADIYLGSVYYEDAGGFDTVPDTIRITWNGGAPGTQLSHITIDTDKLGDGLTIGDTFFDTAAGGLGAFNAIGLTIVSHDGFEVNNVSVVDGGTKMEWSFTGFEAGEQLVFTIDVDEQGFLGPNAVAEGNEWEATKLIGTFKEPHHYDATGSDIYLDFYDFKLAPSGLPLPADEFSPPDPTPSPVRSAGAIFPLRQIPLPAKLCGTVFEDINLNNLQNPGDQGIGNVQLDLLKFDGNNYVATGKTTTTNSNGEYCFLDLEPGVYCVIEHQPNGYFSVGSRPGKVGNDTRGKSLDEDRICEVNLQGGEESLRNDFAEAKPASIRGRVHADRDGDCVLDPGEPTIANVTMQLFDIHGNLAQTTTTNSQGEYAFNNLRPGTYTVRELQPSGYFDSGEKAGSHGGNVTNDQISNIILGSGADAVHYDFCEIEPASIRGRVHVDRDGDCELDAGEPTLAGVRIDLLDIHGNFLKTTTTNAQGEYSFDGLMPGRYAIKEFQPSGYLDSGEKPGSAGGSNPSNDLLSDIELGPGVHATRYDFCEIEPASVRGRVHADRDGDCEIDPGEPTLAGVTVQLLDMQGNVLRTSVTNEQGEYLFDNLAPGTYAIRELQPAGYFDSGEEIGNLGGTVGGNDLLTNITLGPNAKGVDYDFCEFEPSSIRGMVHVDRDGDCVWDESEPRLAGVTMQLLDANGIVIRTTTTNSQGEYAFENLAPGFYSVREVQPNGYLDGGESAGSAGGVVSNDLLSNIALGANVQAVHYDFCELEPAKISGRVFADFDDDCEYDANDKPLEGVLIELLDANGQVVKTTTTNAQGEYLFENLLPGVYSIRETQPAGYFDSQDLPGNAGGVVLDNDLIGSIHLSANQVGLEYNFCEIPPAKLSGYVFQDGGVIQANTQSEADALVQDLPSIRDGARDASDRPIAGVRLFLADATGILILDSNGEPLEAFTDANGFYCFNNLPPGVYSVIEAHPSGYVDSLDTAGTKGGRPFNVNSDPLTAGIFAIETKDAIARIPLAAGDHSQENNFSEVVIQVKGIFLLPPPPTPEPAPPPAIPLAPPPPLNIPLPRIYPVPETIRERSGNVVAHTWHLSVINAGKPRGEKALTTLVSHGDKDHPHPKVWHEVRLDRAEFLIPSMHGKKVRKGNCEKQLLDLRRASLRRIVLGNQRAIPVTGDFDGDGKFEVGVYLNGEWFLDVNGDEKWDEQDLWAKLGTQEDVPVTGDWDGDGKTDIGIYGKAWPRDPRAVAVEPGLPDANNVPTRPDNARKNVPPHPEDATSGWRWLQRTEEGELRADLIDHVFLFGNVDDRPVIGDFTGTDIDQIGVYRDGGWTLDIDGDGKFTPSDSNFTLGRAGDHPVIGDFDGDGVDELGIYRDGKWLIDINHDRVLDECDLTIEFGESGDIPVVGDFDGDGADDPAVYRPHLSGEAGE